MEINSLEEIFGKQRDVHWEELFGTVKHRENCPETDLLEACFEQGFWDYIYGPGKTKTSRKIHESAKQWIFGELEIEEVLSFDFICEHIKKYDPVWFKEGLIKALPKLEQVWKSNFKIGAEAMGLMNPAYKRRSSKPYRQRGYKGKMKAA